MIVWIYIGLYTDRHLKYCREKKEKRRSNDSTRKSDKFNVSSAHSEEQDGVECGIKEGR